MRALITGASGGIGSVTARMLAERGAKVAVCGRDAKALASLSGCGPALVADLTEPGEASRVVHESVSALGGLDVLISCAGAGWAGPLSEMTPDEASRLISLNLTSSIHLAQSAFSHLYASGGQLVLIGSIAGLVGVPGEAVYSATKAGLSGFADALRGEWGPLGICVSLVSPGVVDTPFFSRRNRPYNRSWPSPIPPERVAAAIFKTVEERKPDVIVPAWLTIPARLRGGVPWLYRQLASLAHQG